MCADRIKIEGPADGDTEALKRMSLSVEIAAWRSRAFAPDAEIIERIPEHWPLAVRAAAALCTLPAGRSPSAPALPLPSPAAMPPGQVPSTRRPLG